MTIVPAVDEGPSPRSTRLAWAGIAATYVLARWNLLAVPFERDEGAFGYIGRALLRGELPYRDVFDHKPPLVYYIYALALKVVPATPAGIHFFLHLWNFGALISVYALSRLVWRSREAGLWAAFFYGVVGAAASVQGFSAMTEVFMLWPLAAGLWAAWKAGESGSLRLAAASGALEAAACWTKHTAGTDALFAAAVLVLLAVRGRGARESLKLFLSWSLGAGLLSAAVVLPYALAGAWGDFFYCNFTHNFAYMGHSSAASTAGRSIVNLLFLAREALIPVGAAAFAVLSARRLPARGRLFAAGFLAASLAGVLPGYAYAHYLAQLVPALALAAGGGAWFLCGLLPQFRRAAVFSLAAASLAAPVAARPGYYWGFSPRQVLDTVFRGQPFGESPLVAAYLAARTAPQDAVLIVGSEPQILLMADRRSPIPFCYMYPLIQNFPRHREFQKKSWEIISHSPPPYIVVSPGHGSLPWDGVADLGFFYSVNGLIGKDYALEAVCPVGEAVPRLITEGEDFERRKAVPDDAIRIYRRRAGTLSRT